MWWVNGDEGQTRLAWADVRNSIGKELGDMDTRRIVEIPMYTDNGLRVYDGGEGGDGGLVVR